MSTNQKRPRTSRYFICIRGSQVSLQINQQNYTVNVIIFGWPKSENHWALGHCILEALASLAVKSPVYKYYFSFSVRLFRYRYRNAKPVATNSLADSLATAPSGPRCCSVVALLLKFCRRRAYHTSL